MRTEEEGCKLIPGGGGEVVGLSTGWAGRAQCSLEAYEPSGEGQGGSEGVTATPRD